jgi:3-isopropylmalate/(R)-2-methylmalate dehydratase small subunit
VSASTARGRAWVFGDNVDTDALAPGLYMKRPIEELATHCLETVNPNFSETVAVGDFVVGGRNFGMGSSREQAAQALKYLGVTAVIAQSFAGIFYRNALNLGLPVVVSQQAQHIIDQDQLRLDLGAGILENLTQAKTVDFEAIPPHLLTMVSDGGLVPHLEKRFKRTKGTGSQ